MFLLFLGLGLGAGGGGNVPVVPILNTATAFWDFNQASAPFTPAIGPSSLALVDGAGSTVTKTAGGPFGSAVSFDGSTDYLIIPAANVGVLNMAAKQAVTVVGWVQRTAINQANFIAGMWQEDNADPKRQYGLFVDLPSYGGDNQVCGHVSKTGGATPGYPFSRDYSATGQELPAGEWAMVGFTYDGAKAISYYDGVYDVRPTFTDNQGQTYAKNPYLFPDGLNTTSIADFTVGAVKLTAGFANWMKGLIGGVAVFDRALTPAEMTKLRKQTLMAGESVYYWSMYKETATQVAAETQGWKSAATTAATVTSTNNTLGNWNFVGASAERFFYRSGTNPTDNLPNRTTPGIGYLDTMDGLLASEIASISVQCNNSLAADTFRIVTRFGSTWYATEDSYSVTGDGRTGSSWATSETKTVNNLLSPGKWRALSFVPGTDLTLGANIPGSIPDGPLTGIGFYSPLVNGVVRVRNLRVFAT